MTIPITYLRSSMNGTFEMCELKFFLSYILGHSEPSNKKADLGTMVHKVMEILAKIKLGRQQNKRKIDDEIVGKYSTAIKNLDLDDIIDQVFNHYAKAFGHHVWDDADHKIVIKWVYKAITDYNAQFDPLNQDIVQPEQRFSIQLDDVWAKDLILNGTIDLLIKRDATTYEIVDYKTGKRINWATGQEKTFEYLQNDFQLRFYHLAASILYPEIEDILVTIYYINDGGPFTIAFGKEDLPETKRQIEEVYNQIRFMEHPKMQDRVHPKKWGAPCKFCSYAKQTFEGTDILPIVNKGQIKCHFSERGQNMTMCEQTQFVLQYRDIEMVMQHMTKNGYNISKYKPPGETS